MNESLYPPLRWSSVFIVIVCALAGFFASYIVLNNNFVQYSTIKPTLKITVQDYGAENANVDLYFKVTSRLDKIDIQGIDTTKENVVTMNRNDDSNKKPKAGDYLFHQNPTFMLWTVMVLIMLTMASGCAPVFAGRIRRLRQLFRLSHKSFLVGFACVLLIGLFLLITNLTIKGYYWPDGIVNDFKILLKNGYVLSGIVVAMFLLIIPVMLFMFLIAPAAANATASIITKRDVEQATVRMEMLGQGLRHALQVLSIVVVLSILTSAALRLSINNTLSIEGGKFDVFPEYTCYAYGLYFSFFLCIMYVPVHQYLSYQHQRLREVIRNLDEDESVETSKEWKEKVLGKISFEANPFNNIKLALMMLSPFITSLLPNALHVMKE